MLSIRPTYFKKFQCDGKICGSRCCKGWRITVDKNTYLKYESISDEQERDDILSKLERIDDKTFSVKMRENWDCPFLDEDYLCKIQKRHGADYLTAICHSYPRVNYKFGEVLEQSLTLTCPVAAKLILLPEESIEFEEVEIEEPRGIFDWTNRLKIPIEEAVKIQVESIAILQNRNFSIDERLLKLCFLFNGDDVNFENKFDINEHAKIMVDIFAKMYEADMNEQKKINLRSIYVTYNDIIKYRLLENYSHIFENYLVNEFFMRCYPYAFDGDFWKNCRIFIIGYKAMEFAIILTAISKNGFVTVEEFLSMIDAVNEKLDHNRDGMKAILELAESFTDFNDFAGKILNI